MLFIIYIFRKFESNISKGREAMAPRLYQSEATRNLMNLRIILLKFSENVYVEKALNLTSITFSINIALSPSKRQCGLANWGCRGRIGGGHHYDVKSTLLDSACLRVSIQTKIFCLEWNLRLLGHRGWKWRPPVYSMTMGSSDLKFSGTIANTKAQHLGPNTCHWKKRFP